METSNSLQSPAVWDQGVSEILAHKGTPAGVFPRCQGGDRTFFLGQEVEQWAAQENLADLAHSKQYDRPMDSLHGLGEGVEGRIRQAQTLRGDGFITGNHVHDSFHFHPVKGFFHVVEKRTEDGGDGRDGIQPLQARA